MGRRLLAAATASVITTALNSSALAGYVYNPNDFATSVVSTSGSTDSRAAYSDPTAILGQPPLSFNNSTNPNVQDIHLSKIVEPPFNYGPAVNGSAPSLLLVLPAADPNSNPGGSSVTVKMGQPVTDDPRHLYGDDFIVFGNSFYIGGNNATTIDDSANLNNYLVTGSIYSHPVQVSVSPDNVNWFSFPVTAALHPYNGYQWNDSTGTWTTNELNPTVPLNPAVYTENFAGQSAANVLDAYGNSAGGTAFDLENAVDSNGKTLAQDGYGSIQYVRLTSTGSDYAVISGVSVVGVPEPAAVAAMLSIAMLGVARRKTIPLSRYPGRGQG